MLRDVLNTDAKAILFIISVTCCRSLNMEFLCYLNTILCYDYMNTGRGNRIGRHPTPPPPQLLK